MAGLRASLHLGTKIAAARERGKGYERGGSYSRLRPGGPDRGGSICCLALPQSLYRGAGADCMHLRVSRPQPVGGCYSLADSSGGDIVAGCEALCKAVSFSKRTHKCGMSSGDWARSPNSLEP